MEDSFADQPQEVVNTGPELAQLNQGSGAACEDVQAVDNVTEAQNQTAGDDCGDQGSENFSQSSHDTLQSVLVLLSSGLGLVLADAFDAGNGGEVVVEVSNSVADDDLELTSLSEGALDGLQFFDSLDVGLCGIVQNEAHTGDAVADCSDVFLATNQLQQCGGILGVLAHNCDSSYIFFFPLRNLFEQVPYGIFITYLFEQVNSKKVSFFLHIFISAQYTRPVFIFCSLSL